MPIFAPQSNSSNSARTERSESPQSNDSNRTTREQEQGIIVEDSEMCSEEGLQRLDELRTLNLTYDQATINNIRISEALLSMERSMKIREDQYNKNMETMRSKIMEFKKLLLGKRQEEDSNQ